MQVHTARPTTHPHNLLNILHHNQNILHHSPLHHPCYPVVVDHAILRKHIGQSHPGSNMLSPNPAPKPRPLVEQDFEVIGLSDNPIASGKGVAVRPPPGAAARNGAQPRRGLNPINTHLRSNNTVNGSAPTGGRELLSAKTRPSLPATQSSPASIAADHLALPVKTSRRKRSPTVVKEQAPRHATPSPPSPRSVSLNITSSTSITAAASSASGSKSGETAPAPYNSKHIPQTGRRKSWQPGRKPRTVEEIERECDDDDDDEIPEDTALWNIPLSPRANKTWASASSAGSTSPSPNRFSSGGSPTTERRRDSGFNGGETPIASQSTVSLPSLSRSESNESESRGRLKTRGKSWGDVIYELGNDAKDLTEALERYADESMEAQERALQRKVQETRNMSTTPPRKERIALPPKQVSESHMDPLPMSKEKEAALSRTRPGWLPPKNKVEEEKHLKEYQEMMRLSMEYDRKRAEKEKLEAANREKHREAVHQKWDTVVIPNWNTAVVAPTTRELWWEGVSPKSRGLVWQRAIGNPLKVTEETFTIALERAKHLETELNATEERSPQKDQFRDIRKDAEQSLPALNLFQAGGPLHQHLVDVLMAYSVYRKDIGYTFGLHSIAAHLLLNQSAPEAFMTMANLLNRALPLAFYIQDEPQITNIYNAFLRAFQYKLPSLYEHIHKKLQLPPPLYLEAMFTTLFSLHVPIDIVSRLWDVYAFEGDPFLIRTAVAVMTVLEGRLYGTKEEVMELLGWSAVCNEKREWRLGTEDDFMVKVRSAGKVEVDGTA